MRINVFHSMVYYIRNCAIAWSSLNKVHTTLSLAVIILWIVLVEKNFTYVFPCWSRLKIKEVFYTWLTSSWQKMVKGMRRPVGLVASNINVMRTISWWSCKWWSCSSPQISPIKMFPFYDPGIDPNEFTYDGSRRMTLPSPDPCYYFRIRHYKNGICPTMQSFITDYLEQIHPSCTLVPPFISTDRQV